MPNWLIIMIVIVAVIPGVAIILIGVVALFLSPPAHDPLLAPGEPDTEAASSPDPNASLTSRK
jgi:hypothetical protein